MNIKEISCPVLYDKILKSFTIFDALPRKRKYTLNFSGGKDSHALLICYLLWQKYTKQNLDIVVRFSDTKLEEDGLYDIIEKIEDHLSMRLIFERVTSGYSYWYYQFAYGNMVPNHFNRWCTGRLKIEPLEYDKQRIPLTGRHYGESTRRDRSLDSCSNGECGIDKIKNAYEPIVHFRDCEIWDLIFFSDNTILYKNVFNNLRNLYENNTIKETGSLRMGCIMCPIVSLNNIKKTGNENNIRLRELLEELRLARRIRTPRAKFIDIPKNKDQLLLGNPDKLLKKDSFNQTITRYIYSCLLVTMFLTSYLKFGFHFLKFHPLGALYVGDRRRIWRKIDKAYLIEKGYISKKEIKLINDMLKLESYPKTYSEEWIKYEYRRLNLC